MANDEQAIRQLIDDWQRATAAGDATALHELMADDVIFLTAGQSPMRGRAAFAAAFVQALLHVRIASVADIQEIVVSGDVAYCWTHLTVTITPLSDAAPMRRSGFALTVLRKQPAGHWVIVRDANMLTPETS